jgi:[ribosomal protein S5]-alanine N-acetyltransferase
MIKKHTEFPRLETPQLILRKLTLHDQEEIYDFTSSEEVTKYVPFAPHQNLSDTERYIKSVLEQKMVPWGIVLKENQKLIGVIEFVSYDSIHRFAEIAYVLSQNFWGKGITTEAANEVIKFGFDSLCVVRIQARCFAENIGSQRVMEKVGMTYEGTLRKSLFLKGKQRDIKVYSILKEEFSYRQLLDSRGGHREAMLVKK